MANSETVDRILDTAEILFAQNGFSETSLREITSQANVNLAAVNYHFGSKEALIQAIFERFLTPFCTRMEEELEKRSGSKVSLEELTALVNRVALTSHGNDPAKAINFLRLVGLAYNQRQGHLREYLKDQYGSVFKRLLQQFMATVPDLEPMELFWRVHFALGAGIFVVSGFEGLQLMCKEDFGQHVSLEDISSRFVNFVVGGFAAPVSK